MSGTGLLRCGWPSPGDLATSACYGPMRCVFCRISLQNILFRRCFFCFRTLISRPANTKPALSHPPSSPSMPTSCAPAASSTPSQTSRTSISGCSPHLSQFPLFEHVDPDVLRTEGHGPVLDAVCSSTEEGIKVDRNGGKKWLACFRRIDVM